MKRKYDMNPLVRITFPFVLGIITSNYLETYIASAVWLAAMIMAFVLSIALYKNELSQCITIYLIIYMLGGYLTKERLTETSITLPSKAVSYEAVIISEPTETNNSIRYDIIISNTSHPLKLKASFPRNQLSRTLRVGDGIKAKSTLKMPECQYYSKFDYPQYLRYHNYAGTTYINIRNWRKATISTRKLPIMERARLSAAKLRHRLLQEYAKAGIQEESLHIISAMTLGDKSHLTRNMKDAFSISGASHILALSGLHLSIIYAIISFLMGRRRKSFIGQSLLIISIWTFTFIVGTPPSAVRASIMLTVYSITILLQRNKVSFNTLALAALIILIHNPFALYDTGFQLSFVAVLSILLLYQPVYGLFPALQKNMVTRYIWQITAVSIAAQTGVMPLAILYFERIPCYSLIANIIVVPVAMLIICGSIAVFLFYPIPQLQHITALAVSELTKRMSSGITFLSSLPYSSINISISVFQAIMIYIIIIIAYLIYKTLMPQQSLSLLPKRN